MPEGDRAPSKAVGAAQAIAQSPTSSASEITEGSGLQLAEDRELRTTARSADRIRPGQNASIHLAAIGQGDFKPTSASQPHGHWLAPQPLASITTPTPWPRSRLAGRQGRRTDHATADRAGQGRRPDGTPLRFRILIRTHRGDPPAGRPGPRMLWAGGIRASGLASGNRRCLRGSLAKGCFA